MNVSFQNIDKVSALLTIKLEKADYQQAVDKSLKSIRQKAQMPGFRKGMVPMNLIKKMYGKSVAAEEINKILSEKVYDYIKEKDLDILAEPLPSEKDQDREINFDTDEELEFSFDIALVPEFTVNISAEDHIDYVTVDITDEMVENQIKSYAQRGGQHEKVNDFQEDDMLKGLLIELDENGNAKEGGILVEGAVLMPLYMKNEDQKTIFTGSKVGDTLIFNPYTAYNGFATEMSALLRVDKENVTNLKSNFSFKIQEITRFIAGALGQDIFDMVFGEGVVKTVEEFRVKIKESLTKQFKRDSDYKVLLDARKILIEKAGKLEFADSILRRFMLLNNKDKENGEQFVNDNYDKSVEELIWHLIKEQLTKDYEIKVDQNDLFNSAKDSARIQLAQYGMINVPDDLLENYAEDILKKQSNMENLINRVVEGKLTQQLKERVTLTDKTVSFDEFQRFFDDI